MKNYQYVWELLDHTQLTLPDLGKIPIKYAKLVSMKEWLKGDIEKLKELLETIEPVKNMPVPVMVHSTFSRTLKIDVTDTEIIVEVPVDVASSVEHRNGGSKLYGVFDCILRIYETALAKVNGRLEKFEAALLER